MIALSFILFWFFVIWCLAIYGLSVARKEQENEEFEKLKSLLDSIAENQEFIRKSLRSESLKDLEPLNSLTASWETQLNGINGSLLITPFYKEGYDTATNTLESIRTALTVLQTK